MAKLVGAWLWVAPRKISDGAELVGGATIIITQADKQQLGNGFMNVHIRVMDWDRYSPDDLLFEMTIFS